MIAFVRQYVAGDHHDQEDGYRDRRDPNHREPSEEPAEPGLRTVRLLRTELEGALRPPFGERVKQAHGRAKVSEVALASRTRAQVGVGGRPFAWTQIAVEVRAQRLGAQMGSGRFPDW
jgi:hypothetical protein